MIKVLRFYLVSCKLFEYELIVGFVLIQAPDNIVAIMMSGRTKGIFPVPVRLGKTDDIEPVSRPAFTISGRSQKFIDQTLLGQYWVIFVRFCKAQYIPG